MISETTAIPAAAFRLSDQRPGSAALEPDAERTLRMPVSVPRLRISRANSDVFDTQYQSTTACDRRYFMRIVSAKTHFHRRKVLSYRRQ